MLALVFIGGLIETVWLVGLKVADSPAEQVLTSGATALNVAPLLRAIRVLPIGWGDAVLCGLGAAASVLAEMV